MFEIIPTHAFISVFVATNFGIIWISHGALIKKFTRILLDIPIGFISSYIGAKRVIIIGMLSYIVGFSSLLTITKTGLLVYFFLNGFGDSCTRGKTSIFQYNALSKIKSAEFFAILQSVNFIFISVISFIFALFGYVLFSYVNHLGLIYTSIAMIALNVLIALFIETDEGTGKKSFSFKKAINFTFDALNVAKKAKKRIYETSKLSFEHILISLFLGFAMLSWQLNSINQAYSMRLYSDQLLSARVFILGLLFMIIGCIIGTSLSVYRSKVSVYHVGIIGSFLMFAISMIPVSKITLVSSMLFPVFFYFIEIELKRKYIGELKNKANIFISISTTMCSIAGLTFVYIMCNEFIDAQKALRVIYSSIFILLMSIFCLIRFCKKRKY